MCFQIVTPRIVRPTQIVTRKWSHENVNIWEPEGFQKKYYLIIRSLIFFIRRVNPFLLFLKNCVNYTNNYTKLHINYTKNWIIQFCLIRKYFSNYKQKSNSKTRIDIFDAKSSRYPNSHTYPNSHRFFGLTIMWLFGDTTVIFSIPWFDQFAW